jgi:hypothetical protein
MDHSCLTIFSPRPKHANNSPQDLTSPEKRLHACVQSSWPVWSNNTAYTFGALIGHVGCGAAVLAHANNRRIKRGSPGNPNAAERGKNTRSSIKLDLGTPGWLSH